MKSDLFRVTFLAPDPPKDDHPRLYPLEPYGIGTSFVEAQTGYITRLAQIHSLTSNTLFNKVIVPAAPAEFSCDHPTSNRCMYVANGYGVVADRVANAFSILLQNKWDIRQLSFLGLQGVFDPRGHGLIRQNFHWCPTCWREDNDNGLTPYLRLIWCSRAVDVCTVHECFLEQSCPHCGAHQNALPHLPFIYVCQSCGNALYDKDVCVAAPPSQNERAYWDAKSLMRLIERLGSEDHAPDPGIIPTKLKQLVDTYCDGGFVNFGNRVGMTGQLLRNWVTKQTTPIITPFMDLCYRLSIPLDSFLLDSFELTAPSEWQMQPKQEYLKRYSVSNARLKELSDAIHLLIQTDPEIAPSVSKFARELGVSAPFLKSHFPDEYVLIQHRSSEFQNELRKKSRRERSRHLKKSVAELLASGQTISHRHIKSLGYMKPSDLRRPEIKKRIKRLQTKYELVNS